MRKYKKGPESPLFKDLTNLRFGNLLCIEFCYKQTRYGNRIKAWKCLCDCGNFCYPRIGSITKQGQTSCMSCSRRRTAKANILKENLSIKNRVYRNYKRAAIARSLCFDLSFNEFFSIVKRNCYYCGQAPTEYPSDKHNKISKEVFVRNGVDRKNNSIGYTTENCVASCSICNRAKMTLDEKPFVEWVSKVYKYTQNRKCSETIPTGSTPQANGGGKRTGP